MSARLSLLRNLLLLGAVAVSAPLLTPASAAAADGCISESFGDGSVCVGCREGACWGASCYDAGTGEVYTDGGCTKLPPPPQYA